MKEILSQDKEDSKKPLIHALNKEKKITRKKALTMAAAFN